MLPKNNNVDKAGTLKAIEEHLRSHHDIIRAPLAYIVRKTITVKIYGDPKHATPDDEKITRMLHLPQEKNKLLREHEASSVNEHTAEYEINNKEVCNILDQT